MNDVIEVQQAKCAKHAAPFLACEPGTKVGIARNVRDGLVPLNGMRTAAEGGTNGWYIWAGETLSEDPDFFVPLHVEHLADWCPEVIPYLGLSPGWRFLIAPDHEDVWFDPNLR